MGGVSREDDLAPYPDGDDEDDWEFGDVPVDSDVDVLPSFRRDFDDIHELCHCTKAAVPEEANGCSVLLTRI